MREVRTISPHILPECHSLLIPVSVAGKGVRNVFFGFFLCVHIILYIWPADCNWPKGKYLVLHVVL